MRTYCALTARKLKTGTYDEWRKAWDPADESTPEDAEVYIVRSLKDPDEVIAFALVDGDIDELRASIDPEKENAREGAMAPYVESIGADGLYEVIEHIPARSGARG